MTAILLMLKSFFGGLLPGGFGAATGVLANPLNTIKKILTLAVVLIVVGGLAYYGYTKYKDNRDNREKVEANLANTANSNAATAGVIKDSGEIDTKTVAENAEQKQKINDNAMTIDKEHSAWIDQLKREDSLKTSPSRTVVIAPVKKPVKKGTVAAKAPVVVEAPVTIEVPENQSVRSKRIAAANIAYLWKSYCAAVSESEEPCPT
jgi:type II secretory pathway pseudopilin PulG